MSQDLLPPAPLCRSRAAAAERGLREMTAVLTGDLPIATRGAAMASWLLSDGTGPLRNHHSAPGLSAAVREAARQLISLADTPPDGADPDNAGCYR
jgi:hypothetical protein